MFIYTDYMASIDAKLADKFSGITWIGELPLTERDFRILAGSVAMYEHLHLVPPRVLIVSMVFCARYAVFGEDESINFWGKYFQMVVQKKKTPLLENEYRKAFRDARGKLQAEYQFDFPTSDQTAQEVVSGIYLHAILPAYLQEDFAEFFLKQYPDRAAWQEVDRLFADEIASQNEQATFTSPPFRKRLVRFLQNSDTSITAARLIKTLATSALWHYEGQNSDDIQSVLAPVEREIWRQMLPMLPVPGMDKSVSTRQPSSRVRWAWLIEQNDILELHVRNLPINGDSPPDRLVWLPPAEGSTIKIGAPVPEYGRQYCEVNAYHTSSGYVIDNATIIDIDGEGVVVPVDMQDNALAHPVPTGAAPSKDAAFFKLLPDELAVLSDVNHLTDGDYAISLPEGLTLTAVDGGSVTMSYPLLVPKVLRDQGHTRAARYTLSLPVMLGEKRIDKRRSRLAPTLDGECLVRGLAPGALPIYEQGDIWLLVAPPSGVSLERLSVRLTANDKVTVHRLSELDAAGQIIRETASGQEVLRIRLCNYIPPACLLQVELFSGVSRMHGDPRLAGILPPNVHIDASSVDRFYTPSQPANVRIDGLTADQVELASDAKIETQDNSVVVTWIDPRQDAALRLHFGDVILPLSFDVKWSFAWVSPLNGHYLWEDALSETVLSIRGAPKSNFYISVADGEPRLDQLNARGVKDVRILEHALVDMLRAYEGARIPVKLWFVGSDERIDLFTFIRPQFTAFENQPQIVKEAVRAFKAVLRHGRREIGLHDPYWLAILPHEYSASLPEDALPPLLKALRATKPELYPKARAVFPQQTKRLRLSDTLSYPLAETDGKFTLTINRPHSAGESTVVLQAEFRTDGLYIHTTNTLLRQCLRCGDFFWADDKTAKLKHSHGKFGIETRDLSREPIVGTIKVVPLMLEELRSFTPRFDPFIQRDLEHSLRIKQRGKARDLCDQRIAPPLTSDAYAQATAHWVLRIGITDNINNQFESLYKSHTFVDQITAQLVRQSVPRLIVAGRWISAERAHRETSSWQMLDPVMMTLAVISRAYAHGYCDWLNEEQTHRFSVHLRNAYHCCPRLLTWALLWAELIFNQLNTESQA